MFCFAGATNSQPFSLTGMSWSFRLSTLNKNRTPIMQLPHPHLEIAKWLDVLDLRQYEGKSDYTNHTNQSRFM